ncbi:DUF4832 domain-containing protein [Aliivibrio fischeri]|uniref:DUF4832 domain-containing protein n=1 Tax=Aliivibrio fischeri TaxID=668 RepID=UPI0012DA3F52|nr:DUF4832 domain-containing protein [Aliivibrio fischeri]MUL08888.1 DUF4832 domain-containing protein [Aliivibrio fischeri]MUL15005.1 DUF4832 domain-containing protein [Aliivibrio fischeri]
MSVFKYSPLFFSLFLTACGSDSEDPSDTSSYCDTSMGSRVTENGGMKTTFPKISCQVLVNPDIGFTDFHRIDSHIDTDGSQNVDNSVPSYPATSTVYYRWDWSVLQPTDSNSYDFSEIENVIKKAKNADKKLALRITAMEERSHISGEEDTILEESRLPKWLMKKISGKTSPNGVFVPDYTSSEFLSAANKLITKLGEVFDDPDLITSIDIGMVGSWGEWNLEDAYPGDGTLGLYASGEKGLFSNFPRFSEYADMFESAFTQVPRVMLIGSANENETFLAQATTSTKPAGWRADCLGDKYGYVSNSWSHMDEGYPEALANAEQHGSPNIKSIWKQAPVQFETCDDMTVWKTHHSYTINDVTEVFNYALDHHASLINAKSKPIPDEFQPAVQEVLKKLGYRFELISLTHSKEVLASSSMSITSEWKNSGVAPSYYPYRLAYRFVDASGNVEAKQETSRNVLDWLPAETRTDRAPVINIQDNIKAPASTGIYDLQVALVNDLGDAQIKLAIDMPQENNWYTISKVTIN